MDQQSGSPPPKPPSRDQLERENTQPLFVCRTVFPFTLFPTTIEVTQRRVTIQYGLGFMASQTMPILVDDIFNVIVTTGILFASVQFELRFLENNPEVVQYLQKHDALELKRVLMGLIEVNRRKVDLQPLSSRDKRRYIRQVGTSTTEVTP